MKHLLSILMLLSISLFAMNSHSQDAYNDSNTNEEFVCHTEDNITICSDVLVNEGTSKTEFVCHTEDNITMCFDVLVAD